MYKSNFIGGKHMFNSGNCASVPLVASIDGCGNGGNNNGAWGDNGAWWIIIFVLFFAFGGWGNNGWGNNGGNTQFIPYQLGANYTDSAIARGFDNQAVVTKLDGITQGICDSTYALNNTITNGFAGVNSALCQGFNGVNTAMLQGFNGVERGFCNLSSQLSNCCCDIERGIDGINYNNAMQTNALQNTMCNNTRDIIESQNSGTRAVLDKLSQIEYNNLNDKYQAALSENQSLKFAASQTAQNAYLTATMDSNRAELIRRLGADCPVNAVVVQPNTPVTFPTNCCGQFNGWGNGYNNGYGNCGGCNSGCGCA